jgi:hypothetical protein
MKEHMGHTRDAIAEKQEQRETKQVLTTSVIIELLRDRHTKNQQYAFLTEVTDSKTERRFDALAFCVWASRGYQIDIFEVKVSRQDWLKELAEPSKADAACQFADRFWIVAPASMIDATELPEPWGLMQVHGDGTESSPYRLRVKRRAPKLRDYMERGNDTRLSRGQVAYMLKATPGAIVDNGRHIELTRGQWREAYEQGRNAERMRKRDQEYAADRAMNQLEQLVSAYKQIGVSPHDLIDDLIKHANTVAYHITKERSDTQLRDHFEDHLRILKIQVARLESVKQQEPFDAAKAFNWDW